MDYKAVLRHQPWLRFANKHNISFRFLEYSHGDLFIAYNTITNNYELHSVRSYKLTDSSCNGVLEPNQVNGFAYEQFRESELRKFMLEIISNNEHINSLYDRHEAKRSSNLERSLKQIELTIGTRV